MNGPQFEIVTTSAGAISIRDNVTREIMHNPVGPWAEANALYIDQSRLGERLRSGQTQELVIFDVGLGAAANAVAILHCARQIPGHCPLKIVSFERDLALLKFALAHVEQFPHLQAFVPALNQLMAQGFWSEGNVRWELRFGDYPELIKREPSQANLIFFEPYSPTKNPEMWSLDTFTKTFQRCAPDGATLITYSCATPVRVALLLAGFYVGVGAASGLKAETTQAGRARTDIDVPLGQSWLERWGRSHTPNAAGVGPERLDEVKRSVLNHPQFQTASEFM